MHREVKILLFAFWLISVATPLHAQFQPHLPDLRECQDFNCPANNFTIQSVYLSDINGNPISNTVRSCSQGQIIDVYISLRYSSNSGSNVSNGRLLADLEIGSQLIFINYFLGEISPSSGMTITLIDEDLKFAWSCGETVNLLNPHTIYTTTAQVDHSISYTCENNSYGKSQCGNTTSISVTTPHILDFVFQQECTVGDETPVSFENISRGGLESYYYRWDFMTGVDAISSTDYDTLVTYYGNGTATLTVTDENGVILSTYSQPVTLRETDVVDPFTTVTINQTDTINPNGAIILDVVRPGEYTYLWSGPDGFYADEAAIYGLKDGVYTVAITDEYGCVFVYEFQLPAFVSLPLPVELLELTYSKPTKGVSIRWKVPKGNRAYGFQIERSYGGIDDFLVVGYLAPGKSGEGTSGTYAFVDSLKAPRKGRYYYRIKALSDEEEIYCSEVRMVNVSVPDASDSWRLYPNPVNGSTLHLQYVGSRNDYEHRAQIRVYSPHLGAHWVLHSEMLQVDLSEVLDNMPGGLFFVEIRYADYTKVFKVIR
ncbi:T9SS type A sorting domain-containing protein [Lunatimonas salinarum]|uniref:T9SS type A sorting domain-containing protein n=1 Tax=Lunatimonas salinarum TaxID=1774590 RepID=UPI001ADFE149|nr:T9SS type A sorting domain-containing protein [Lunatimonas salinarum]